MRIYVAGRFKRYARCRALMDRIAALGHVIAHDWTRTDEFGPAGNYLHLEPTQAHAISDLLGVISADLLVIIADEPLCGALVEVGAALAMGTPVWVIAPWRVSVFWKHPLVTCYRDEVQVIKDLS